MLLLQSMRFRLFDFLPLLLALSLVAAWFGLQQPLPWQTEPIPAAVALVRSTATPTSAPSVPRATALLALCDAKSPRFLGTLANLQSKLGARMGQPADCEKPIDAEGNTQQLTTTGLAYYRRSLNLAAFTNGWEHWALTNNQIVHWAGNEVDPPSGATSEP
jgi:hypothetical protein